LIRDECQNILNTRKDNAKMPKAQPVDLESKKIKEVKAEPLKKQESKST